YSVNPKHFYIIFVFRLWMITHQIIIAIIADHGNADVMVDPSSKEPFTAHTTNPVPVICVSDRVKSIKEGALCDVAPTLLTLAGLEIPKEMTGKVLVEMK
ncbi:MAG: hypothetical protein IIY37_02690, partial [Selenomonadaceae bacterium]|nr:hypothetical protein [Selenomonadaceae bacterium]